MLCVIYVRMRLNQYISIYTVFNTADSFVGSPSELNGNCHSIRSIQLHLLMHTRLRLLIFLSSPCFASSFVPVPLFPNGNPYARMKYASQIRTNCVPFTKHFFFVYTRAWYMLIIFARFTGRIENGARVQMRWLEEKEWFQLKCATCVQMQDLNDTLSFFYLYIFWHAEHWLELTVSTLQTEI